MPCFGDVQLYAGPPAPVYVLADVRLLDGLLISAVRRWTTFMSYRYELQKSESQEKDGHAKQMLPTDGRHS